MPCFPTGRTAPFMAIIQEVTQPGIKTLKSVLSGVNLRRSGAGVGHIPCNLGPAAHRCNR